MKKKTFVAAIIISLLVLFLIVALKFNFGEANPIGLYFPHNPHTIISILNPANNSRFYAKDVQLNFTLDLSLWYPNYMLSYNPSYSCNVSSIQYYVDNTAEVINEGNISGNCNFSVNLQGLDLGEHRIEVKTMTDGRYWNQVGGFAPGDIPSWNDSAVPVLDSSGLIYFYVDPQPTPTQTPSPSPSPILTPSPSPTLQPTPGFAQMPTSTFGPIVDYLPNPLPEIIGVAVVAAVAIAGLIVYFKRRNAKHE